MELNRKPATDTANNKLSDVLVHSYTSDAYTMNFSLL